MSKSCFIIMPISGSKDYPEGHFDRVYEFIVRQSLNYTPDDNYRERVINLKSDFPPVLQPSFF